MSGTPFDRALRGGPHCVLELAGGERIIMPVARWRADPDAADELLLARCAGPTLDVGCGPGRLAAALTSRGVPTLGIDVSAVAVRQTRKRGAAALRRDVFDRLPGEGRWRHVLLADGNVGIGGDPRQLLRRIAELLDRRGSALVEVDPPGVGLRRQQARLATGTGWFPWARLGADAIATQAAAAGFTPRWRAEYAGRWFVELVPHRGVTDDATGAADGSR
ncbi:MAG TPA: class I SAM-dependent methyltransferase [Pseudonocardiaceae bacterium]|jgi:SAM-dependent methyltransferase|nr:class I SAM-dependent methyltransferase [Pseudonocardiaceae bacterium]